MLQFVPIKKGVDIQSIKIINIYRYICKYTQKKIVTVTASKEGTRKQKKVGGKPHFQAFCSSNFCQPCTCIAKLFLNKKNDLFKKQGEKMFGVIQLTRLNKMLKILPQVPKHSSAFQAFTILLLTGLQNNTPYIPTLSFEGLIQEQSLNHCRSHSPETWWTTLCASLTKRPSFKIQRTLVITKGVNASSNLSKFTVNFKSHRN